MSESSSSTPLDHEDKPEFAQLRASFGRENDFISPDHAAKEKAAAARLEGMINKAPATMRESFSQEINDFTYLFRRFLAGQTEKLDWSKISPPVSSMIRNYGELRTPENPAALLSKLIILKLNGGLGTTMGCTGPKSAIEVRDEQTFLDLVVNQVRRINAQYGVDIPLVLMNSFNTEKATQEIIGKYPRKHIRIITFNQSRHPRIWKDSLLPMPDSHDSPLSHWCPPGHGDIYQAFVHSGLARSLQREGKEVVFLSNIDNLGAEVDFNILDYILGTDTEFLMELTPKSRADVKGGTLVTYDGSARLLELAQVPAENVNEFKSIKKFKVFNTNNLWIKLPAISRVVSEAFSGAANSLNTVDLIVNSKKVDGKAVIQLETACGAAIKCFQNSQGIEVPRSRFLPVKSTADLFLLQSNLYSFTAGSLRVNPLRSYESLPLIKLDEKFNFVDDYAARFQGHPDLLELDHLTVSGDVHFGKMVTLRGTVIIVAQLGSRIDIPDGAILENKIITGNLRILDH
ncbi:MAG: UTP--glucose-1-phosphate uridylyltransferase [archaeon]|nr:UTP--glucose-1-phosphate uridylyltransferase [archaeon]